MKTFLFLLLLALVFIPICSYAGSAGALPQNQEGRLSVEQVAELGGVFNRQFLLAGFLALIFAALAAAPIVGLCVLRRQKDPGMKSFIIFLSVILWVMAGVFFNLARKHFLNKKTVNSDAPVGAVNGIFEKYAVKTGKFGEVRKYQHEINGEQYSVWPDDLLKAAAGGGSIAAYYVELLDTDAFAVNKTKKMIVNYEPMP